MLNNNKQSKLRIGLLGILLGVTIIFAYQYRDIRSGNGFFYGLQSRHFVSLPQRPNLNVLYLGKESIVTSPYEIQLNLPIDLNYKTKKEIYEIRSSFVKKYPDLIKGSYLPSEQVFGQIIDGRPWWGLWGQVYGAGQRSIEGLAEESRFIANPFLLVTMDFWHDKEAWNLTSLTEEKIRKIDFSLTPLPKRLTWWPVESRAEMVYDLSEYIKITNQFTNSPLSQEKINFDLVAYNARDFNLNYMYISFEKSRNIIQKKPSSWPFQIIQFIHMGNSCGYPGGCNNMSPADSNIDDLTMTGLPAQVYILLWKKQPKTINEPADMTFVIHID